MVAARSISRFFNLSLAFAVGFIFSVVTSDGYAANATLAWDPNSESNLAGYKIHYGTASGSYSSVLDVGKSVQYTVAGLTEGKTYHFAVTAYNASGQSSDYSNEVSLSIPAAAGTPSTPSGVDRLSDDFSVDSRSYFTVANTWTQGGVGQLSYDGTGKRLKLLAGDNIGLEAARPLPVSDSGVFQLDFLPTRKYPDGGRFKLRLMGDENTYYEISNSDGYGPGQVKKWVAGQLVASAPFQKSYVQNTIYRVNVSFSPTEVVVQAFGDSVSLSTGSAPILVNRFALELRQQDAYVDNLFYTTEGSYSGPNADAGVDQTVREGESVVLDGSASEDTNGMLDYQWQQTAGVPVSFDPAAVQPRFTAPAVSGSNVVLQFKLTVTNEQGASDTDSVTVTVLPAEAVVFLDDFNVDSRSAYTLVHTWTQGGKGQLLYDGTGKRLRMLVGDNIGSELGKLLPASDEGIFQLDFLPTQKYPSGGRFKLRLMEDENTYYEISNSDGYGPGGVYIWVDGRVVASTAFKSGYAQNKSYRVGVSFGPTAVTVQAFGQVVSLNAGATPILVSRFALELRQQDAYIDNIGY